MNDHLKISPHGLRLIQDFEGAPRLKARLCEGGKYELGWGCTYYPDNSPVKEGDTIDLSFAPVMLQHAATVTENAVKRLVHIPLTQPQFDGLCGFVYNVGEANAATSTVIRETNAGRFEDAAAAFGMWVFATKAGYKQALRGLLRRRYAEACTYLGYHYTEACADEAVALQREKPAKLPGADRVLYKTPFANILRVAQHYPLAESPEPAHAQVQVLVPTVLERVEVAPAPLQDSAIPTLQATIDGIPTQLPLPGEVLEDELVLEQPAASEASADVKGSPPVSPQPIPAAVPSDSNPAASPAGSPAPSLDPKPPNAPKAVPVSPLPAPSAPVGKPKDPPPVIAGQDGAKPKSPWTVQPEEVHYKIDPGAGLKPLEDSDRAKAFYWQRTFMFVIYLGGAGLFGSTFMAGSTALMKHAALMSVLLDLIVPLAIALSGLVLGAVGKSWADWRRQRAQTRASQGLY